MAVGWARDDAVQDQIDASVGDAVKLARSRLPSGEGLVNCEACEALIPLLMFPAATESWTALLLVTGTFGLATVGTMLGLVFAVLAGVKLIPFPRAQRFGHALAGVTILLCGVAIEFIGL